MQKQLNVLTIGNVLIDAFLSVTTQSEDCHKSEHSHELCLQVGAKIPVTDSHFFLGGNASNIAVGLSRLGYAVGIVAETGDDDFSHKIIKGLAKEEVCLDFLKQTAHTQASFSISLSFVDDRVILSRHIERKHDLSFDNADVSWIYLTSLGNEWKNLYEKTLDFVVTHNVRLAFNPGSMQMQAGISSFMPILQKTEILFVNREEAEKIVYGTEKIQKRLTHPNDLLMHVQELGPSIVCLTDGNAGSYAIDKKGKLFRQGIIPALLVQKTGAGDGFATGFMASMLEENEDIQRALLWGAINSASVVEHMGAQTGLLIKEKLIEKYKKQK